MNSIEQEIPVEETKRCRPRCFWMAPLILVLILAKGGLVMLLWNALIPELFQGPQLNYLQALGLMILAKLLVGFGGGFKRFGHHGHHGPPWRRGRHFWNHMSVEDREKLREGFRRRCGHKDSKES